MPARDKKQKYRTTPTNTMTLREEKGENVDMKTEGIVTIGKIADSIIRLGCVHPTATQENVVLEKNATIDIPVKVAINGENKENVIEEIVANSHIPNKCCKRVF